MQVQTRQVKVNFRRLHDVNSVYIYIYIYIHTGAGLKTSRFNSSGLSSNDKRDIMMSQCIQQNSMLCSFVCQPRHPNTVQKAGVHVQTLASFVFSKNKNLE